MYGGSGSGYPPPIFEDLWYFPVPPPLQVRPAFSCLQNVPCLAGVSVVLGWASAGVTLALLLCVSSPAGCVVGDGGDDDGGDGDDVVTAAAAAAAAA